MTITTYDELMEYSSINLRKILQSSSNNEVWETIANFYLNIAKNNAAKAYGCCLFDIKYMQDFESDYKQAVNYLFKLTVLQ